MKTDNRGFTLVELIVCVVILSIVMAAAFGFMVAGSKSYTSVTNRLDLQLRAKVASSQIEDRLIDCSGAVYFSGNSLYVVNAEKNADGKYTNTTYIYSYDATTGIVSYASVADGAATEPVTAQDQYLYAAPASTTPLAEKVTAFNVTFTPGTDKAPAASATLTLTFEKSKASLSTTKTVALRNTPKYIVIAAS